MQLVSNKVCEIGLQSPLYCTCHLVHLRLDTQPILKLAIEITGKKTSAAKVATKIFFQLMEKSSNGTQFHAPTPVLRFFFTDSESAATTSTAPCKKTICGTLMSSDKDYEGFFHDKDGNGKTGLRLQHTPCEETPDFNPERISFHELVSRSSELLPGDILRIAANLARSILRFDCSPWAPGWTPETIQFFQKARSPGGYGFTSHLWTPHLCLSAAPLHPVSHATVSPTSASDAIHQLGVMLLRLRRGPPLQLENIDPQQWNRRVHSALEDLRGQVGVKYGRIVSGYLNTWGVKDVDLMEEASLRSFLSEILVLERLATDFP